MRVAMSLLICLLSMAAAHAASGDKQASASNPLERALLEAQKDPTLFPAFMDRLIDSQVLLLSKQDVLLQQSPDDVIPLVLPAEAGSAGMVAVFTSPSLAHRVAATYPEYRYGVKTDFVWVLAHTAPGLGLRINPGWTMGLQIPSYGLLRMRERYADRIEDELNY